MNCKGDIAAEEGFHLYSSVSFRNENLREVKQRLLKISKNRLFYERRSRFSLIPSLDSALNIFYSAELIWWYGCGNGFHYSPSKCFF